MEPPNWKKPDHPWLDRFPEVLSLALLFLLFLLPLLAYNRLPGQVPQHFDLEGNVTSYGPRYLLWMLPALGLVLYLMFTLLARNPARFRHAVRITPENAAYQYTLAFRTIRWMKTTVLLLFLMINQGMLSVAAGKSFPGILSQGASFALLILLPVGIYYFLAVRHR